MISTRNLSPLPAVDHFRRLLQSMAMLDAILSPEWEFRYYSFDSKWSPGEQMGSMRDGGGDDFFAHFSAAGCWLKGFAHESPMSPFRKRPPRPWAGVLDDVPSEFEGCLREPAFSIQNVTFCIWRRPGELAWQVGHINFPSAHADPDGSEALLSALDGRPESYSAWAAAYYEREVDTAAVAGVYRHQPLTQELVARLNPEVSLEQLSEDIEQIGYEGA